MKVYNSASVVGFSEETTAARSDTRSQEGGRTSSTPTAVRREASVNSGSMSVACTWQCAASVARVYTSRSIFCTFCDISGCTENTSNKNRQRKVRVDILCYQTHGPGGHRGAISALDHTLCGRSSKAADAGPSAAT